MGHEVVRAQIRDIFLQANELRFQNVHVYCRMCTKLWGKLRERKRKSERERKQRREKEREGERERETCVTQDRCARSCGGN